MTPLLTGSFYRLHCAHQYAQLKLDVFGWLVLYGMQQKLKEIVDGNEDTAQRMRTSSGTLVQIEKRMLLCIDVKCDCSTRPRRHTTHHCMLFMRCDMSDIVQALVCAAEPWRHINVMKFHEKMHDMNCRVLSSNISCTNIFSSARALHGLH